jgi:hypothetical protein
MKRAWLASAFALCVLYLGESFALAQNQPKQTENLGIGVTPPPPPGGGLSRAVTSKDFSDLSSDLPAPPRRAHSRPATGANEKKNSEPTQNTTRRP